MTTNKIIRAAMAMLVQQTKGMTVAERKDIIAQIKAQIEPKNVKANPAA